MTTSLKTRQAASGGLDWRYQASCLAMDPELFFPVGTSGPATGQARRAKRVCRICPVMLECLDWALRTGQDDGIWGGLTAEERRQLQAKRRTVPSTPAPAEPMPDLSRMPRQAVDAHYAA